MNVKERELTNASIEQQQQQKHYVGYLIVDRVAERGILQPKWSQWSAIKTTTRSQFRIETVSICLSVGLYHKFHAMDAMPCYSGHALAFVWERICSFPLLKGGPDYWDPGAHAAAAG